MIEDQEKLNNVPDLEDTNHSRDEDEESALTTLDANEPMSNINLSEYCISSDADTEKMESDIMNEEEEFHPKLSKLLEDIKIKERQNSVGGSRQNEKGQEKEQEQDSKLDIKHHLEDDNSENKHDPSNKKVKLETSYMSKQSVSTDSSQFPIKFPENNPNLQLLSLPQKTSSSNDGDKEQEIKTDKAEEIKESAETEKLNPKDGLNVADKEVEEEEEEADQEEDADEDEDEEDEQEAAEDGNNGSKVSKEEDEKPKQTMPSPMELENRRLEAMDDIINIEYKFAELRQKLYENKLIKLELELQMCLEGSHPELRGYYEKIVSIRDYKLKRAYQRQKYELQCIDRETRATRTMIHQDFYKKVSDLKRDLLTSTTKEWYDINKERRGMDNVVPEVSYHVPIKIANKTLSCITGYAGAAQQRLPGEPLSEDLECENIKFRYRHNPVDKLEVIVDRMRLNNALSDFEGLKRYYGGFPGAPVLNGLRDSEIVEDFQELQLLLQQQQTQSQ